MQSGILFVCHANMCRSPMAEYLGRSLLSKLYDTTIPVASAGTHAEEGRPMHPHAVRVLAQRKIDGRAFSSRALTSDDVMDAGLVLTATRLERTACATLAGGSVRHIFTIRQFGRLAEMALTLDSPRTGAPKHADRLELAISATVKARSHLQPVDPWDDDLDDPIGLPPAAFKRCAATVEAALRPVTELLALCTRLPAARPQPGAELRAESAESGQSDALAPAES